MTEQEAHVKKTSLKIVGMTCATCSQTINQALLTAHGVQDASVNLATETAYIEYNDQETDETALIEVIRDSGYDITSVPQKLILRIGGMTCAMCVQTIEEVLSELDGVIEASVNLATEKAMVTYDPKKIGYKEIYNDALMGIVNSRIDKLKNGELDVSDYTIKGALEFIKQLREKGVKLYLASGTDRQDVLNESKALGYAELFDGGIYGAVGDVAKYSKKMVIENIMTESNLSSPELVVFGDGPVELRECRKRDGIAVGIATDEIRRHGLNIEKRTRLIKAGAHIIVPDFSQHKKLIKLLFKK